MAGSRHGSRDQRRAVAAWVLYDWSYGAFTTIVSTFVFATYFTQAVASDKVTGTAQWAGAQSLAGILIALLAVPLGAVADRGGRRKRMLGLATSIMVLATAGLWFVRPHAGDATLALALVVVATVAFEVATVFYNAMLPGLASPGRLGRLSMLAWGAGYAGGLAALGLCLGVLISPKVPPFGLDPAQAEPVRACALLAAGWLALFAWPVAVLGPPDGKFCSWPDAWHRGLAALRPALAAAWRHPAIRPFLLARLLYMDGLVTLFAFGGIYAAGEFGFDAQAVLIFGIALSVTAGLGVLAGALVEDRIGARATILVSVLALAGLGAALLVVHDRGLFWTLGLLVGVFVGPAQAASRSLMARLAPAPECAANFGLLALSGRVTAFAGPLALSVVTAATGSLRAGMAVIVVFLLAGAALMFSVPTTMLPTKGRSPSGGPGVSRSPATAAAPRAPPAE